MDGQTACKVNPTAAIVTIASPIASDRLRSSVFSNADLSISCASRYSSGAINSTMNSSGSSFASGKNGRYVTSTPSTIWTSGVETLGTKRLTNELTTTAAMMHRMSSNTAMLPPSPLNFSPPKVYGNHEENVKLAADYAHHETI